jgi:Leucine-rich repeat (LRR) protein
VNKPAAFVTNFILNTDTMKIHELQRMLLEAYTVNNLNNISLTLINLYKNQQYSVLQKISEIISDYIKIKISNDGKGFSKLLMLYHPDRAVYHIKEINRFTEQNNFDSLIEYSHILKLVRIEEISATLNSYEDIDYSPVYEWDPETEGFSIINDSEPAEPKRNKTRTNLIGYTFYDAIKMREYGDTDVEFPSYYLEDIEEFELSSSDIKDLDGIQFCIHAKSIDLSNNRITDLDPIAGLKNLEELNLSDNQVGYIDVLSNLINLKSIILSNNFFEDISPLFELEKLEYADLSGNKVDIEQINRLIDTGVNVDY